MIYDEKNNFRFDEPHHVKNLNEHQMNLLRESEESSEVQFIIPPEIRNNKDKHVYKIGFVAQFLKLLYPEEPFPSICRMMSERYDIFISRRQIDRTLKKFQADSN